MHYLNSRLALICCCAALTFASMVYFPRWQNEQAEATIGWDASGYYLYLPSVFIYHDVKELKFKDAIWQKYQPTPGFSHAFKHPKTGNYVIKYSCGQAIAYIPFFLIAHASAKVLGYPADGFSRPYQFMMSLGGLLIAFLGLFYLRKVLLRFFSDGVVANTLILLVVATNYFEYASITACMTHNTVFTLYAMLLYYTVSFYEKPKYYNAAMIGALIGWATIIRPTEAISCLIPVLGAGGVVGGGHNIEIKFFAGALA